MSIEHVNLRLEILKGFTGKVVQAVIGFAGTVVFARVLGATSFGGFYFLLALVFLVDRPLNGLSYSMKKRISEADPRRDELLGVYLLFGALYVFVLGIVVAALADLLRTETNVENAGLVFLALVVSIGVFSPLQDLLSSHGYVSGEVWNDTLRSVLTFPLQLLFVLLGFGAAGMGYGLALATVLVVPVGWYFVPIRPEFPSRTSVVRMWEHAKYTIPHRFVGKTYDRMDVIILGVLVTTAAVANYEVALKLTLPATFVTSIAASGLMPKVSNLSSKGEELGEHVTNSLAYVSILAVPIFFGALAMSEELVVTAYGPEYAGAGLFLVGLALYQVVWSQGTILRQVLAGIDRPDILLRIDTFAVLVNVVLGVGLVVWIGSIGVVVATIFCETLRYVLVSREVASTADVSFLPEPFLHQIASGVVMFLAVRAFAGAVELASWIEVGAVVGFGAGVYGAVLLAISPGLRMTVRGVYRDTLHSEG